jgi:membrane protein implicated in regulation of membrane protease activity
VKLKTIFVIFNFLIGLSFLFVFFMPALFLGWDYTRVFWGENWYLAVLFIAVLALLNGYFGANWRLFTALEHEDWNEVATVMERRIYTRHRYTRGNIRLLVNAYVVSSQIPRIGELETHLREHSPRALTRNALLIGIPHLLSNDGGEMVAYYGAFLDQVRGEEERWIRWSYAFALMLDRRLDEAKDALLELARGVKPGIIQGLSVYLLDAYVGRDETVGSQVAELRQNLTTTMSRAQWQKAVERRRSELYVLVLSKLLGDVETWLYDAPSSHDAGDHTEDD